MSYLVGAGTIRIDATVSRALACSVAEPAAAARPHVRRPQARRRPHWRDGSFRFAVFRNRLRPELPSSMRRTCRRATRSAWPQGQAC